ncbi:MAG: bifunctional 5,10-methylenetetrahydrofolate dehydrogenase/5,10-methenyltetrahydrofolate cyclohydrolase [Candidatus Omnitrophota bacterium]
MAKCVNGREIAKGSNNKVKNEIQMCCLKKGRSPKLVSLSVGYSEDAEIYMNMQKKVSDYVGVEFVSQKLPDGISQDELIGHIEKLNLDKSVTSVIIQKPLPKNIDHNITASKILPEKDAEGITPCNLGRIFRKEADIVPCTPGAVMKILTSCDVGLYGKEVVIVGHSAIVGKPLSLMMLNETATVTVCHVGTAERGDIMSHTRKADILIVAVGKAGMVKSDWIKEGAVVIDVGINKVGNTIQGDVDFLDTEKKASIITPVPGGVGPVTVSILMRNVLRAYRNQNVKI